MVLYVGIAVFLVGTTVVYTYTGNRRYIVVSNKILFERTLLSVLLSLSIMMLLTGLRGESVGNDTLGYFQYFRRIANQSNLRLDRSRFEWGFQIYCFLISRVSKDPHFFMFFSAILCYHIIWKFIIKNAKNQIALTAVFFALLFSTFTSGLRQAIALCICLIAYNKIKDGKNYIGGLLILLASTFHLTALSSIFYYIITIKEKRGFFSFFTIGVIVAALIYRYTGIADTLNRYLIYYQNYSSESGRARIGILGCTFTLIQSIISFLLYRKSSSLTANSANKFSDSEIEWFAYILIVISVLAFFSNNLERLLFYYQMQFYCSLFNRASETEPNRNLAIVLIIVLMLMLSFFSRLIFRPYYFHLVPYTFFWQ